MIINLNHVARNKELQRKKQAQAVKIVIANAKTPETTSAPIVAEKKQSPKITDRKPGQLNPIWEEFNKVKNERAKFSNKISAEVARGASKSDLKKLVDAIKEFSPRLQLLFDQARHVDQYGTLPKEPMNNSLPGEEPDTWSLKDQKRKLIDKRCKLQSKLNAGSNWMLKVDEETGELSLDEKKKVIAHKSKKQIQWQLELDQINAEYQFVDEQLKKLEGKI